MSTAAAFLDTEKAFDTTGHIGLLYKLSNLKISIILIKLNSSFLSQRKFSVLCRIFDRGWTDRWAEREP
jgi:hypothetical protein